MIILILLIVSFALFFLAFVFILIDVFKAKKKNKEGSKKEGISKLSGYSYGIGLLALLVLMIIGAILSI